MTRLSLKNCDKDTLYSLLELITYKNLSYPTGFKDSCSIILDDKNSRILTPDVTYQCDDDLYILLYLLSNKTISYLYQLINNEINKK